MEIYLDNASTTKVDEKVIKSMLPYFSKYFGNASSLHKFGRTSLRALENSRKIISKHLNAKSSEIIFTSSGTEGNNLVLKGLFFQQLKENTKKHHLITSKIEHKSVLQACKWLEAQGVKISYLDVDNCGFINLKQLSKLITKKTFLVSIIHANNEIGTIQDIDKISMICKKRNVLFHIDACQSFTKVPIDVKKCNIDFITLNSHKIHGPKGVGALYIKEGVRIAPLFHGGGQERELRSGTENIPGIVGFAEATKISSQKDVKKIVKLRDHLIAELLKIPNTKLNGPVENRLCNNINISFSNIEGEALGGYLEREGIFVSTGSACISRTLETSHVLKAIGLTPLEANSSIRISLSKFNTEKEIEYVIKKIKKIVNKLRFFSPLK